jgi:hypothetical protein
MEVTMLIFLFISRLQITLSVISIFIINFRKYEYRYSVNFLEGGIGPSQGFYLQRTSQIQKNSDTRQGPEWVSNPWFRRYNKEDNKESLVTNSLKMEGIKPIMKRSAFRLQNLARWRWKLQCVSLHSAKGVLVAQDEVMSEPFRLSCHQPLRWMTIHNNHSLRRGTGRAKPHAATRRRLLNPQTRVRD